jgi:hypothetical protein
MFISCAALGCEGIGAEQPAIITIIVWFSPPQNQQRNKQRTTQRIQQRGGHLAL